MNRCLHGQVDEYPDEQTDRRTNKQAYRRTDKIGRQTDGRMEQLSHGQIDKLIRGREMNEQTDLQTDEWAHKYMDVDLGRPCTKPIRSFHIVNKYSVVYILPLRKEFGCSTQLKQL